VTVRREFDEEAVAELLSVLPPAPEAWVQAAQELPAARLELERLVELAQLDHELAEALRENLEGALAERSIALPAALQRELRERLERS
jgi:hypothetical protein